MRKTSIFAASVLIAMTSANARAQSQPPDHRSMFSPDSPRQTAPQTAKQQPPRPKAASRADTAKRTTQPRATRPAAAPPRETARLTAKDTAPAPAQPKIGRIPFETGTLGFTTDTQYKTMEFNDGRRTPGFENIQRKDSSYLGFSLSVPTDRQTIFPLPLWPRPD